ncbi:Ribosomal RNA small subunit methyltransferase G [Tsuneonella dongtanensis]|uniref:Ribosomal RNA small subunit methyltransferase G n=1 Tax=Tsuneonella dongtanensis TaxID=692370 RepID=A0A1B2AAA0_9SPHN|nr:16S rRNA (guanine(527)-N(7))-methyltransferase RsmG [Tsuneonella dongtanensis]ANY19008.1 Ribosomal RNA small subunit methyltransferase G [Tsuneonella dongtanensis]
MIVDEAQARAFVAERCDADALDRLEDFAETLREENGRQNLVSAASLSTIWQRHIADSAQLLDHLPAGHNGPWMDLGTGAGFPGLVIAAMRPGLEVELVESRRLRIDWLERCKEALHLANCTVIGSRLELVPDHKVNVLSARAFAPLPKLVALARRFSTGDTVWLLPKGRSAEQEVAELPKRLRPMFHVEHSVSDPEAGIVVGKVAEGSGR